MSVEVLARPASVVQPGAIGPSATSLAAQYLAFRVGSEEYGVNTRYVGEIRGYTEATRIANAPTFLKGVISLRGTIIPIIDLRIKFGLPAPTIGATTVTIVLNIGERVIGVVVDAVSDVLQLGEDAIKPVPRLGGNSIDIDHVLGIATLGSDDERRMLMLVDIHRWVADAEFWRT